MFVSRIDQKLIEQFKALGATQVGCMVFSKRNPYSGNVVEEPDSDVSVLWSLRSQLLISSLPIIGEFGTKAFGTCYALSRSAAVNNHRPSCYNQGSVSLSPSSCPGGCYVVR